MTYTIRPNYYTLKWGWQREPFRRLLTIYTPMWVREIRY